MKYKFSELEKLKDWKYYEVMESPEFLHFTEIVENDEFELKVIIDGKEYDSKVFTWLYESIEKILDHVEDHIEEKAIELMKEKLNDVDEKRYELDAVIQNAVSKIRNMIPERP